MVSHFQKTIKLIYFFLMLGHRAVRAASYVHGCAANIAWPR